MYSIFLSKKSLIYRENVNRYADVNINYFCFMQDIAFKTYVKFIAGKNVFFPLFLKFTFNWRMIALWCVVSVSALHQGESAISSHPPLSCSAFSSFWFCCFVASEAASNSEVSRVLVVSERALSHQTGL